MASITQSNPTIVAPQPTLLYTCTEYLKPQSKIAHAFDQLYYDRACKVAGFTLITLGIVAVGTAFAFQSYIPVIAITVLWKPAADWVLSLANKSKEAAKNVARIEKLQNVQQKEDFRQSIILALLEAGMPDEQARAAGWDNANTSLAAFYLRSVAKYEKKITKINKANEEAGRLAKELSDSLNASNVELTQEILGKRRAIVDKQMVSLMHEFGGIKHKINAALYLAALQDPQGMQDLDSLATFYPISITDRITGHVRADHTADIYLIFKRGIAPYLTVKEICQLSIPQLSLSLLSAAHAPTIPVTNN